MAKTERTCFSWILILDEFALLYDPEATESVGAEASRSGCYGGPIWGLRLCYSDLRMKNSKEGWWWWKNSRIKMG